jgi:hypothetical protein
MSLLSSGLLIQKSCHSHSRAKKHPAYLLSNGVDLSLNLGKVHAFNVTQNGDDQSLNEINLDKSTIRRNEIILPLA